jgi:hypothetical protein
MPLLSFSSIYDYITYVYDICDIKSILYGEFIF